MTDDDFKKPFWHPTIGTPKTLDEALMLAICIGAMSEVKERSYHVFKDFMAQKFGTAYLEAGDDKKCIKILEDLFKQLTARADNK